MQCRRIFSAKSRCAY